MLNNISTLFFSYPVPDNPLITPPRPVTTIRPVPVVTYLPPVTEKTSGYQYPKPAIPFIF